MANRKFNWKFYGWIILGIATLGHYFAWAGTLLHTFTLFILPISQETGWSRASISLASSIATLTIMFTSPLAGILVDKYGAKPVLTLSHLLFGAVLCGFGVASQSIYAFYALFFMASLVGVGTIGPLYVRLIFSWFEVHKGLAIGIVIGGAAAASALNPPIINWIIEGYGWRNAYVTLGIINLIVIFPLHLFFLRSSAHQMNLRLDGLKPSKGDASSQVPDEEIGFTFAEVLKKRTFWALAATFFLLSFGQAVVIHLVPLVVSFGFTSETAALIASAFGTSMLIARLVTGPLMDRFPVAMIASVLIAGSVLGMFALLIWGSILPIVVVGACMVGVAWGAETDFMGFMVVTYYGRKAAGRLHTLVFSLYVGGSAVGVFTVGALYDWTGSYEIPLWMGVLTGALSLILLRPFIKLPSFVDLPLTSQQSAQGHR